MFLTFSRSFVGASHRSSESRRFDSHLRLKRFLSHAVEKKLERQTKITIFNNWNLPLT